MCVCVFFLSVSSFSAYSGFLFLPAFRFSWTKRPNLFLLFSLCFPFFPHARNFLCPYWIFSLVRHKPKMEMGGDYVFAKMLIIILTQKKSILEFVRYSSLSNSISLAISSFSFSSVHSTFSIRSFFTLTRSVFPFITVKSQSKRRQNTIEHSKRSCSVMILSKQARC